MLHTLISTASSRVTAAIYCAVAGLAVLMLVAGVTLLASQRPASAKPEFAAQTGLPCGRCHVNPAGGGPNTPFGLEFKKTGYKLPGKK